MLGPNGAGKTTAIRILTTILEPTRGRFAVAGMPSTRPGEIRRRTGVLPESAGYPERQTGEEFLRYHARLFGHLARGARAVATALLDEVGLANRAEPDRLVQPRDAPAPRDRPRTGQRTAGGDARRAHPRPRPGGPAPGAGDDRARRARAGTTVLLSTHLLAEVEATCSQVLILNRGRIAAQGTVAEVARQAAAPRTATLRVEPDDVARALDLSARPPGSRALAAGRRSRLASLAITLDGTEAQRPLRVLVSGGVTVLSYELEPSRLSDAFLAHRAAG